MKNKIKYSRCAGAVPFNSFFERTGLGQIVINNLGQRVKQAKYQWDTLFKGLALTTFTYGPRLNRIEQIRKEITFLPGFEPFSHDTGGRTQKQLATPNTKIEYVNPKKTKEGVKYYTVNYNDKMTNLNLDILKGFGLLKEFISHTLDIDVSPVPSESYESRMTYHGYKGYTPVFASINEFLVNSSNRSGNTPPQFGLVEFLENTLRLLSDKGIEVGRVLMDGASYSSQILKYINDINKLFVIRAEYSNKAYNAVKDSVWVRSNFKTSSHIWDKADFTSVPYCVGQDPTVYRLVSMCVDKELRRGNRKEKTKWQLKDGKYYSYLVTNDWETSPKELFYEYNGRGNSEKIFGNLKNSFGFKGLPFSNLNENHVFIQMQIAFYSIYLKFIRYLASIESKIRTNMTLKLFRDEFMRHIVIIDNGKYIFPDSEIAFEKLI